MISHQIGAITVTYNPKISHLKQQIEALSECTSILFVDNGSDSSALDDINTLCANYENAFLHKLNKNLGIASAQNIGAKVTLKRNPRVAFYFFLDHDSTPSHGCLHQLLSSYSKYESSRPNRVGAIGPKLVDPRSGKEIGFQSSKHLIPKRIINAEFDIECDYLNSSGSLIPISSWDIVGGFDASLFIDHVETDWCMRAKAKGLKLIGSCAAEMRHEMGDEVVNYRFLGLRKTMPYRSPTRHYYITRNSLSLYRKSYCPKHWILLNITKLVLTYLYFGILSTNPEKAAHREKIMLGVRHSLKGISGQIPS